jgi:hypothetical protein
MRSHKVRTASAAINASPPTTPPAIAPALECRELVNCEDWEAELVIDADVALAISLDVPVGGIPEEVWVAFSIAATRSKLLFVIVMLR